MTAPPRGAAHVPTLTEVVAIDSLSVPAAAPVPVWPESQPIDDDGPEVDESQLTHDVLADVQRQIDGVIEARLREALAPALARLSDALIDDVRDELMRTLREMVGQAVAREIARHRGRQPLR